MVRPAADKLRRGDCVITSFAEEVTRRRAEGKASERILYATHRRRTRNGTADMSILILQLWIVSMVPVL
jgi:hypothetical protein